MSEIKLQVQELYPLYMALYEARKRSPHLVTLARSNVILTNIMGGHSWSWRVVGITTAALRAFHENDFALRSGHGITRAHLRPRIETTREFLEVEHPLSQSEFVDRWLERDVTVLCARGENRLTVPGYISIENSDARLFCSRQVAWVHSERERVLLRRLFDEICR